MAGNGARALTLAERILAQHAGVDELRPGQVVEVPVDVAMAHEACAQLVRPFEEMGAETVWDKDRIVIPIDHWVPASTEASARLHHIIRKFVERHELPHFYDIGNHGICHQILVEEGFCLPGDVVVGTDSHTNMAGALGSFACGIGPTEMAAVFATGETWFKTPTTIRVELAGAYEPPVSGKDLILHVLRELTTQGGRYRAIEFGGPGTASMPMYQRFTITNMTTELGAKAGLIEPDGETVDYLLRQIPEVKNGRRDEVEARATIQADDGAQYERVLEVDLDQLEPLVACPQSPDNVHPVASTETGRVDQVFIGSCTNARLEDLRVAASILKGEHVAPGTRLLVYPASTRIYRQAMREGIADIIMDAGGVFNPSSCGACFGGMGGVLDEGEVCVSTSNRNFPGRMGHTKSLSYLVSPATAACTAIQGELVDPRDFLDRSRWAEVERAANAPAPA